jgi:hypothetical protein
MEGWAASLLRSQTALVPLVGLPSGRASGRGSGLGTKRLSGRVGIEHYWSCLGAG